MFKRWQWWVCSPLIITLYVLYLISKTLGGLLTALGAMLISTGGFIYNVFECETPNIMKRIERFAKGDE